MAEDVLIVEPGDIRAQKIAKAMASETAGSILRYLGESERSLTDITEALGLPLTTTKYHVENLLDAGVIEIAETRYSVKGREVKMYRVASKLLIVAPKAASAKDILLRYASLFGIVAVATAAIAAFAPLITPPKAGSVSEAARDLAPAPATLDVMAQKAAVAGYGSGPAAGMPGSTELALAFFCGGALVILVLLAIELRKWRKQK